MNKKPLNDQQNNVGNRRLQPLEMSPTESEQSARVNKNNDQSISRIESLRDDEQNQHLAADEEEDLLMSDIKQQNQSLNKNGAADQEEFDQLLSKTNNYSKEIMMGQTIRDLGSTIKEAKVSSTANRGNANHNISEGDEYADDFDSSNQQHQESMNQMISQEEFSQNQQELMMSSGFVGGVEGGEEQNFEGVDMSQQQQEEETEEQTMQNQEEGEEDVIDIDNPDELAKKGLKRIQIEGEEEEFLMDMEGNIYDLRGNFIGTTEGDGAVGDSQLMGEGEEQYQEEY